MEVVLAPSKAPPGLDTVVRATMPERLDPELLRIQSDRMRKEYLQRQEEMTRLCEENVRQATAQAHKQYRGLKPNKHGGIAKIPRV